MKRQVYKMATPLGTTFSTNEKEVSQFDNKVMFIHVLKTLMKSRGDDLISMDPWSS